MIERGSTCELGLHRVALAEGSLFGPAPIGRRPYLDPPRTTQDQGLCDNVKEDDKGPERNTTRRLEVRKVHASFDAAGLTCLVLDEFLWRLLVDFGIAVRLLFLSRLVRVFL